MIHQIIYILLSSKIINNDKICLIEFHVPQKISGKSYLWHLYPSPSCNVLLSNADRLTCSHVTGAYFLFQVTSFLLHSFIYSKNITTTNLTLPFLQKLHQATSHSWKSTPQCSNFWMEKVSSVPGCTCRDFVLL